MKSPLEGISTDLHNHASAVMSHADDLHNLAVTFSNPKVRYHLTQVADDLANRANALHCLANNAGNAAKKTAQEITARRRRSRVLARNP